MRSGSPIADRRPSRPRRISALGIALAAAWAARSTASIADPIAASPSVEAKEGRSPQASGPAAPPWIEPDDLPLPAWAKSVFVERDEQPVGSDPFGSSARRGTAGRGARLPLYGAKRGPGCSARWINVGPMAWICQDAVSFRGEWAPLLAPDDDAPGGLPFRYYFVAPRGGDGYSRLDDAGDNAPDAHLEPGFGVAEIDEQVKDGQRYIQTSHTTWVPANELVPVVPFGFRGQIIGPDASGARQVGPDASGARQVTSGPLTFGWVVEDKAPVFGAPGRNKADPNRSLARFDRVDVLEEKPDKTGAFLRVGDGQWVRARDVRRPSMTAPPDDIRPDERWIDVDLATQTLVAYEGERPVFATLVSTGIGGEGSETATPRGQFRIWVKLKSSDMSNLDDERAEKYYAVEQVPYVQYFEKGVGLHGAFWHRSFGHVRSHGCVNLAPLDAQWLFAFTSPRLPHGWTAVLPISPGAGTLVRVR